QSPSAARRPARLDVPGTPSLPAAPWGGRRDGTAAKSRALRRVPPPTCMRSVAFSLIGRHATRHLHEKDLNWPKQTGECLRSRRPAARSVGGGPACSSLLSRTATLIATPPRQRRLASLQRQARPLTKDRPRPSRRW